MVAGTCALFLGVTALAQDAVEIKIAKPKAGERVKQTREETSDSKFTITVGGNEMAKNEKKSKSLVYVEEVEAVEAGGDRATKLKRTYEKAQLTSDGNTDKLDIEGKTVLIEKKGDKFQFTIDGKDVDADSRKLLDAEFNKEDKSDPRDVMFPKKAVKPGDSWKIDGGSLAKSLAKDLVLDKDKLEATGKLVKAEKRGGKQFGTIDIKIAAPITGLGEKSPIKVTEGKLDLTMTGDGVIDGTSSEGKSTTAMKIAITGSGDGFELKGAVDIKETRTTTPLPKGKR
jgi:hypothetical protein